MRESERANTHISLRASLLGTVIVVGVPVDADFGIGLDERKVPVRMRGCMRARACVFVRVSL